MVGWASLLKKKQKRLQNTRRMIICRIGLNGSGPKWTEWTDMDRRDQREPKLTEIDKNGPK